VEAGNEVHAAVEALCKGQPVPELSRSAGWTFDRYLDFLISEQPEVLESEVTLWSRTHGYAGTADLVMRIRDATWLLDIKTGKNIYPEHGLQLAALASTDFIIREDGTEEPVPDITAQGVLHLRPRSWRVVVAYRQQECWETFLAARRIVRWLEEEAEEVLAA
jgi:hypothetical protein